MPIALYSSPFPTFELSEDPTPMLSRTGFAFLITTLPLLAADADWPQFRGPKRDGVSTEKGLLKSWPDDGPKLAWKATGVGEGFSSVAVAGDTVLTMGDVKGDCNLYAVSRKDGKKLWEA